jgi:hypothetical protein
MPCPTAARRIAETACLWAFLGDGEDRFTFMLGEAITIARVGLAWTGSNRG